MPLPGEARHHGAPTGVTAAPWGQAALARVPWGSATEVFPLAPWETWDVGGSAPQLRDRQGG